MRADEDGPQLRAKRSRVRGGEREHLLARGGRRRLFHELTRGGARGGRLEQPLQLRAVQKPRRGGDGLVRLFLRLARVGAAEDVQHPRRRIHPRGKLLTPRALQRLHVGHERRRRGRTERAEVHLPPPALQQEEIVEHEENLAAGLVDGGDDRAAHVGHLLHLSHDDQRGSGVESGCGLVEEEHRRVRDELDGDGEHLSLTGRESVCATAHADHSPGDGPELQDVERLLDAPHNPRDLVLCRESFAEVLHRALLFWSHGKSRHCATLGHELLEVCTEFFGGILLWYNGYYELHSRNGR